MKIIALGDTHGRTNWKTIVSKNEFDKVVFIGDYFDTRENISPYQQIDNFKDIVEYKKANNNKVVLLFGNHDFHYLQSTDEKYGEFQPIFKTYISKLLHKAIDEELLQMCFVSGDILFTHAGVTKTWCKANNILTNVEQGINDLFKYKPNAFKFTAGKTYNMYGDDIAQTPIWVRPNSLFRDRIDRCIQVVGHTVQDKLIVRNDIVLIDTLGTSGEYLSINNGIMIAYK